MEYQLYFNCSCVRMNVNRSRFSLGSHDGKPSPAHTGRTWTTAAFLFSTPKEPQLTRKIGLHGLDSANTQAAASLTALPRSVFRRLHNPPLVIKRPLWQGINGRLRSDWCESMGHVTDCLSLMGKCCQNKWRLKCKTTLN